MSNEDVDYTPRIVILGAGPIGLESALYARYLGYEVAVIEKGTVANNVQRWGHVKMFSPFSMNRSSLGIAALEAQHEDKTWPADDAILTGKEFAESYLIPLAQSDLLSDCIHEQVNVVSIGRDGIIKTDTKDLDRADYQFRVLVRSSEGEYIIEADYVIDTTGVFDQPNSLGHGGIPAMGESELSDTFFAQLPDILGAQRAVFEGKRILVVGNGYSAATNIAALAQLFKESPTTQVTWLTRRESPLFGPMPTLENDPLPERATLVEQANRAAKAPDSGVQHADQTSVLAIQRHTPDGPYEVTLGGKLSGQFEYDVVIPSVGYRPNASLFGELQVDQCPETEATQKLSEWLSELGPIDALDQSFPGSQLLHNTEPNFFILGSKSFGRNSNFLLSLGLQQIRAAFTIIADRENLNLYDTMS